MEKVIFRNVKRSDLEEVFPLLQQLTEIDYSSRNIGQCWNRFLDNRPSYGIVGIYENKVVAYGSCVIENKIRGEIAGHIEDIVVDKSMRGKNIGVDLISELVKLAEEKGCYRITLFCKEELISFYSKNGFKVNNIAMKKFLKYNYSRISIL